MCRTRISPYDVLGPNPTPAQKRCLSGHGYGMNASKLPHEMLLRADFVAGELPAGVWQEAVPHLHFGHFAVLWAILSIETASCRDAVHICKVRLPPVCAVIARPGRLCAEFGTCCLQDVVKHVGCEKLASGVPAVYLARLIADGEFKPGSSDKGGETDELGVAESWRSACCPSDGSWSSVHALANLEVYLPSPLRFMVAPGHFSSLWFPGHRYDAKSDAPERRVWRRFQHACTCSLLSALCIEGALLLTVHPSPSRHTHLGLTLMQRPARACRRGRRRRDARGVARGGLGARAERRRHGRWLPVVRLLAERARGLEGGVRGAAREWRAPHVGRQRARGRGGKACATCPRTRARDLCAARAALDGRRRHALAHFARRGVPGSVGPGDAGLFAARARHLDGGLSC